MLRPCRVTGALRSDIDLFFFRLLELLGVDLSDLEHAPQHVMLPLFCTGHVGDWIVSGRRLWQPTQHRDLRQICLAQ